MTGQVPATYERERTGLIIALALLGFLLGPLTSVPAWLMAQQDLRDVRAGFLPPEAQPRLSWARTISMVATFINLGSVILLFIAALILFVIVQVGLEMMFA